MSDRARPPFRGGLPRSALDPRLPGLRQQLWELGPDGAQGRAFLCPQPPRSESEGSLQQLPVGAGAPQPLITQPLGRSGFFRGLALLRGHLDAPEHGHYLGRGLLGKGIYSNIQQGGLKQEMSQADTGAGDASAIKPPAQQIYELSSFIARGRAITPAPQPFIPEDLTAQLKGLELGRGSFARSRTTPVTSSPSPGQRRPVSLQQTSSEPHVVLQKEIQKVNVVKRGSSGTPVPLALNLIQIYCRNEAVYQYHVTFSPNIECMNIRFAMLKEHRSVTGEVTAFDGSILYLPIKLPKVVQLKSQRKTDGSEVDLKIQMTKILEPNSDLCIPFYNIVFRRVMRMLELKLVGRNFYDPTNAIVLPQYRLQLWPGFSASIRRTDGGLMLLADVTHKVLRNDSVLEVMQVIYQRSSENFQDECIKQLVGSVIMTKYNNRTYRIDDIDWDKSPLSTFQLSDSSSITFCDYYSKTYGITIRELQQPLLVHRPKQKLGPKGQIVLSEILLVPELSFMTGIPDQMRKDFRAMKDMTLQINLSPEQHHVALQKLINKLNKTPVAQEELARWGLIIDNKICQKEGRVLPSEKINLRNVSFPTTHEVNWTKDIARENAISTIPLQHWALFYTKRSASQAQELVSVMSKVAGPIGMKFHQPAYVELKDDRTQTYVRTIQSHLESNGTVKMIMCIIPGNRDELYHAIKKLCCVQFPVPSQVINVKTISQNMRMRAICQKILLQINCKLGGELWGVDIPLKQLMVIGMDVYHDPRRGMQSVVGFVASLNNTMTKWYSRVTFQMPNQEIIDGLKMCMVASLKKYYEVNHCLPDKIAIYRDGVSDGQLSTVSDFEVPQLLKCFEVFNDYQPKMLVIVVSKRISTNMYSVGSSGRFEVPPPGSVIDHTATSTDGTDFFLLAHTVHQGCGIPTRYICVLNTLKLSPDHMQRLTFKLCHIYWNWSGTIRVPAPCKYAHKVAFLCGQSLHQEPAVKLSEFLFYL